MTPSSSSRPPQAPPPSNIHSYTIVEEIFSNYAYNQYLCSKKCSSAATPISNYYLLTRYSRSVSLQKSVSKRIESLLFLQEKELLYMSDCFFTENGEEFCVVEKLDASIISLRQYLYEKRGFVEKLMHAFSDVLHSLKILHAIDQVYGDLNCLNVLVDVTEESEPKLLLRPFRIDLPLYHEMAQSLRASEDSHSSTSLLKSKANRKKMAAMLHKRQTLTYHSLPSVEDPHSFNLNQSSSNMSIMQFQENSVWYEAPENVFLMTKLNMNREIDAWALGCILIEIYLAHPLFSASSVEDQIINTIHVLGYPQKGHIEGLNQLGFFDYLSNNQKEDHMETKPVPQVKNALLNLIHYTLSIKQKSDKSMSNPLLQQMPQVVDLVAHLLRYNPAERYSINQIIQHPVFQITEQDTLEIISRSRTSTVESTPNMQETTQPVIQAASEVQTPVLDVSKYSSSSQHQLPPTAKRPANSLQTPLLNSFGKREQSPAPTVVQKRGSTGKRRASDSRSKRTIVTPASVTRTPINKARRRLLPSPQEDDTESPDTPKHSLVGRNSSDSSKEQQLSSTQSTPIRKSHSRRTSSSTQSSVRVEKSVAPISSPHATPSPAQVESKKMATLRADETISSIGSLSIQRRHPSHQHKKPPVTINLLSQQNRKNHKETQKEKQQPNNGRTQSPSAHSNNQSLQSPLIHSSPSISTPGAFPFHTPYHATPKQEAVSRNIRPIGSQQRTKKSPAKNAETPLSWITDEATIAPDDVTPSATPSATHSALKRTTPAHSSSRKHTPIPPTQPPSHSQKKHPTPPDEQQVSPAVDTQEVQHSPSEESSASVVHHPAVTLSPKVSNHSSLQEDPVSTLSQSDTSSVEESLMLVSLLNDCKFDLKELTKRLMNQSGTADVLASPSHPKKHSKLQRRLEHSHVRSPSPEVRGSKRQSRLKPTLHLVNGKSPQEVLNRRKKHANRSKHHHRQHHNEMVHKHHRPTREITADVYSEKFSSSDSDTMIDSDSTFSDDTLVTEYADKHRIRKSLKHVKRQLKSLKKSNEKNARLLKKVSHVISPSVSHQFVHTPETLTKKQRKGGEKRRKRQNYTPDRYSGERDDDQNPPYEYSASESGSAADITNYYDGSVHYRTLSHNNENHTSNPPKKQHTSQRITTTVAPFPSSLPENKNTAEVASAMKHRRTLTILIDSMKGIPSKARYYLFRWESKDVRVEIPVKRRFIEKKIGGVTKFVEQKFYIKISNVLPANHPLWQSPLHIDLFHNSRDIREKTNRFGTCAVDLYLLSLCMDQEFYEVNGWYHVFSPDETTVGQIQVRCTLCSQSPEVLRERVNSKLTVYEGTLSKRLPSPKLHTQKHRTDSSAHTGVTLSDEQQLASILQENEQLYETQSRTSDRSMHFEDVWKSLAGFDEHLLGKYQTKHTQYESSGETQRLESTLEDLRRMSQSVSSTNLSASKK